MATPAVGPQDLAVDFELLELRVARERQMLDRMVRFADTRGCRRQNLLRYFGDAEAPRGCDACESCKGSRAPDPEAVAKVPKPRRNAEEAAPADEGPFDARVFESLRALRTELAREARVPPYVVFHDSTLRELARALPRDERSFLAVKGAGPGRWQRYGARVVAAIASAAPADAPAARPVAPAAAAPLPPSVREPASDQRGLPFAAPPWLDEPWSVEYGAPAPAARIGAELWALCDAGATLDDICARLRRSAADVASELAEGAQRGKSFDVGRLLGTERVHAIRTAARGANGDVVAVRRRLSFPAALAEIRLALATA